MKKTTAILLAMMMMVTTLFAQDTPKSDSKKDRSERVEGRHRGSHHGNRGEHKMRIPGLTDEQHEKIKAIHVKYGKEMLPIRNEIKEQKAKLNSLQTAENVDMKAINKTIDNISKLKGDLMKQRAASHQEVRALLNDEQRLFLDTYHGEGHGRKMKGKW
ncbi:Spy/CpxP family protein refolding chaperone [Limibacter armeniacum]|uniref:Spy/CpxP family protein refolding chaperone n=1 Tax=Limibacter armeniacum TaxID=466084 RepID=UPI002FE5E452